VREVIGNAYELPGVWCPRWGTVNLARSWHERQSGCHSDHHRYVKGFYLCSLMQENRSVCETKTLQATPLQR
jgi:hypothetical protein